MEVRTSARRAVRCAAPGGVVHERAAAQGRRSSAQRPELHEEFNDLEIVTWTTPEELRVRIGEQLRSQLGWRRRRTCGIRSALGLNEQGWIPFDKPDGAEAFPDPVAGPHARARRPRSQPLAAADASGRGAVAARHRRRADRPKDKVIQLRNQKRKGWTPQGGPRRNTSPTARSARSQG